MSFTLTLENVAPFSKLEIVKRAGYNDIVFLDNAGSADSWPTGQSRFFQKNVSVRAISSTFVHGKFTLDVCKRP